MEEFVHQIVQMDNIKMEMYAVHVAVNVTPVVDLQIMNVLHAKETKFYIKDNAYTIVQLICSYQVQTNAYLVMMIVLNVLDLQQMNALDVIQQKFYMDVNVI